MTIVAASTAARAFGGKCSFSPHIVLWWLKSAQARRATECDIPERRLCAWAFRLCCSGGMLQSHRTTVGTVSAIFLAVKSTIFKVQLQVNDMDRRYFHAHSLTLARHPSETDERMMVRLLAFALHAHDALQFAGGLSCDEADLWRKDLTGAIDLWIAVGQPDEQQIRRACGRARKVMVYTYSGRSAQVWWQKSAATLERSKNLSVIDLTAASGEALAALVEHGMQMQCFIQDGEVQMMGGEAIVPIGLTTRIAAR
jgi:uncharacterized protein YaeQ